MTTLLYINGKYKSLKWRRIYIAYVLSVVALIMLAFTGVCQAGFARWMENIDTNSIIQGVTFQKTMLLILDMSLIFIAFSKLENEDERVEKIRSFALKNALLFAMAMAAFIGLVIVPNFNLMVFAAFILVYYIILFRLCLYRDPAILYMDEEEMKVYVKKTMKRANIYMYVQIGAGGMISQAVSDIYHNHELYWYGIIINIYIMVLVRTVYYSYKS